MKTKIFIMLAVFCMMASLPSLAQGPEYKPGLNYTAFKNPPLPKPEPTEEAKTAMPEEAPAETPEARAERVWQKYKALAAGQVPDGPVKPTPPSVQPVSAQPAAAAAAPQSGLTAILQEWKNSKSNQREMRSRSFATPSVVSEKHHISATEQNNQAETATP